jgi:hypothetical protein
MESLDRQIKPLGSEYNVSAMNSLKTGYSEPLKIIDGKPFFNVSQTLIKMYTNKKSEYIPRCPYKIYILQLTKEYKNIPTLPMLYGSYFEYKCIGGNARDVVNDLPRLERPKGSKSLAHIRIDEQVIEFKRLVQAYGINILPHAVQKSYKKPFPSSIDKYLHCVLTGTIDFEASILLPNTTTLTDTVFDLKLCANLNGFGEFDWSKPEFMDLLQADFYVYLTNKHFIYWIFEHGKNKRQTMYQHYLDETNINNMFERIEMTLHGLYEDYLNKWPIEPNYDSCDNCPLNKKNGGNCPLAINIKTI